MSMYCILQYYILNEYVLHTAYYILNEYVLHTAHYILNEYVVGSMQYSRVNEYVLQSTVE